MQSDVRRWSSGRYAFRLKTWRCCGLLWEELLSARFPGRDGELDPVCPTCGAGDRSPPYSEQADFRQQAISSNGVGGRWGWMRPPVPNP
jgi:hypothetical protein